MVDGIQEVCRGCDKKVRQSGSYACGDDGGPTLFPEPAVEAELLGPKGTRGQMGGGIEIIGA